MQDFGSSRCRIPAASLALVAPLAVAALVVGLAPRGETCSPAHPRTLVEPCGQPQPSECTEARRAVASPAGRGVARHDALRRKLVAALDAFDEGQVPAASEARVVRLLVDLELDAGRLQSALDTLAACDAAPETWTHAGWRLDKGGQAELARRAWTEALRRDPAERWAFEELSRVDPAAALAALDRAGNDAECAAADRATLRAQLLAACGRRDEAVAVLRELPRVAGDHVRFWALFSELAPEEAFETLGRAAREGEDVHALADYARALFDRGLRSQAVGLLSRPWGRPEVADTALAVLVELDPPSADAALRAALELQPDRADLWRTLGENAHARGDLEGALDAWMRGLELDAWQCDVFEPLWEHRREEFLTRLGRAAEREASMWLWEECGDWRWRSGLTEEALEAWSTAVRLDPEASGASDKLAKARTGRWPL